MPAAMSAPRKFAGSALSFCFGARAIDDACDLDSFVDHGAAASEGRDETLRGTFDTCEMRRQNLDLPARFGGLDQLIGLRRHAGSDGHRKTP